MFRQGLCTVDVIIIVLDGKRVKLSSPVSVIKEVADKGIDVPVLICFHRADEWAHSLPEEGDTACDASVFQAAVAANVEAFYGVCERQGVPRSKLSRLSMHATCFSLHHAEQRACLVSSLVWDVRDVHAWIKSNVAQVWADRLTQPVKWDDWKQAGCML